MILYKAMDPVVSKNTRILSLDVFRGLTIVLMILVNSQGTRFPYPILAHADWNGCTLADLVFPSFLFIVGVSICISLNKQIQLKPPSSLYLGIMQRTVILFALGLLLNAIPFHFHMDTIRVFGILQRIALCYFFCALIYLHSNVKVQIALFLTILLSYWLFLTRIPVPGYSAAQLTMEGNWVAYIDQSIFSSAHLLEKTFDPEGLLSTISSIATTLSGVLIGQLLLSSFFPSPQAWGEGARRADEGLLVRSSSAKGIGNLTNQRKLGWMIFLGSISVFIGWLWSYDFPVNKNLWSSSFVLLTSGISLLAFALCFFVIDIKGYKKWALPLKIFGMNALFAFVFHVFLLKMQFMFPFVKNGETVNLKEVIADYLFGFLTPQNAALSYSILFLLLNFLVVAWLYKRKIFIRI